MEKMHVLIKGIVFSTFVMLLTSEAQAHHRPGFCTRHPHSPHCTALRIIPPPPACYHHPHVRPCRKHFRHYQGGNPYQHRHRHHHHYH